MKGKSKKQSTSKKAQSNQGSTFPTMMSSVASMPGSAICRAGKAGQGPRITPKFRKLR